MQTLSMPVTKADTLQIPIGDAVRTVSWRQIVWLAADGNYARIFTHERDYFYHRSLGGLLAELGEDRFVRIHRSWAVNIAEIVGIWPLEKGAAELRLRNGQKLRTSRRFKSDLSRVRNQSRSAQFPAASLGQAERRHDQDDIGAAGHGVDRLAE